MISAGAIADAAQVSWTNAVRHSRVDLAEVCCTADSQLAGEVISKGGAADRYSYWNGYDLTIRKGTEALRSKLESTRPRWIWMSPPCGPDSPMQNLNQRTDTQIQRLEEKRSRAHRIQKNLMEIFVWLQGTSWCEEAVLEQSSSCWSLCKIGNFSELKRQFHGTLVPGCQWGLRSGQFLSSNS